MIKIISGYTGVGGSTVALIELTNQFNARGLVTCLYGNQPEPRDHCVFVNRTTTDIQPHDIVLYHCLAPQHRPPARTVILLSHEKMWFPVARTNPYWDNVVFLNEEHRQWHNRYTGPSVVIPNFQPKLVPVDKPALNMVAGVIGLSHRKCPHISIERALADGCEQVLLYGDTSEVNYFEYKVQPLLGDKVKLMGFTHDRQAMYNSIGRVYHSSTEEIASLVKDECQLTNTMFYGNEHASHIVTNLTNDQIFGMWKQLLTI
jgi:hypothetical protein